MRFLSGFLCALLVSICGTASALAQTSRIPIESFFEKPNLSQPQLSPDGTKIAFLFPYEKKMAIGLFDLQTNEGKMVLHGTDEEIAAVSWKGNDRLVFHSDVGGNESFFIGSTDLQGKKVVRIAESQSGDRSLGTSAGIVSILKRIPTDIVVAGLFLPNNGESLVMSASAEVRLLDVRNKSFKRLLVMDDYDRGVVVDHQGALRLRVRLEGGVLSYHLRNSNSEPFKEIFRESNSQFTNKWQFLDFSGDDRKMYLISRDEETRGSLYSYNTETRVLGPALFTPPEGEITGLIFNPDETKLLGIEYEADRTRVAWVDKERAALQIQLEKIFPNFDVSVVSTSDNGQVMIVLVASDREPGKFYIFDQKKGSLTFFKSYRSLEAEKMCEMTPITYTARDGLELHGYLTLPKSAAGKPVPFIINPHGGPYGVRDSWGFIPEVQFLANRGYGVLQINYRGSGGYGNDFIAKGRYQWGRAMQDDLSDGVKWLIDHGYADPKHIAIYGASYGGYAALAGVTLTPDLYCCAVNYVGPSDLTLLWNDTLGVPNGKSLNSGWLGISTEYENEVSPVHLVERIRVPTLHAYGDNDPRVHIKNWDILKAELKKHHKVFESIEEAKQGHGFRNQDASLKFYSAMEQFFDKYLAK